MSMSIRGPVGEGEAGTLMSLWQMRLLCRYCRPEIKPKKSLDARASSSTP